MSDSSPRSDPSEPDSGSQPAHEELTVERRELKTLLALAEDRPLEREQLAVAERWPPGPPDGRPGSRRVDGARERQAGRGRSRASDTAGPQLSRDRLSELPRPRGLAPGRRAL